MILARYAGRILVRFAVLIALLLYLISFLDEISRLAPKQVNTLGDPLGTLDKLLIALSIASHNSLDFMPIIFMLSGIFTLVTLGRRAELHIMRGAGLSGGRILIPLGLIAALAMTSVMLVLRPLAFEASQWAEHRKNPTRSVQGTSPDSNAIAWISAEDGGIHGRLEGFDPVLGRAKRAKLVDSTTPDLEPSFLIGHDVRISETALEGTFTFGQDGTKQVRLPLSTAPSVLSFTRPNFSLPLPYLLGWIDDPDRWSLSERQTTYLIMRALAEPFLTAALVLLAGTLCVEIETRQPLARLIFGALGLVVMTYSVHVIANAFGLNGKLHPLLAAWGMPLMLYLFGLSLLAYRDLSWHLSRSFLSRSFLSRRLLGSTI